MNVHVVSRENASIPTAKTQKSKQLLKAIQKLQPGGKALRISFKDQSELNSLRNIVYKHNKETGDIIKSSKDQSEKFLYFFKN